MTQPPRSLRYSVINEITIRVAIGSNNLDILNLILSIPDLNLSSLIKTGEISAAIRTNNLDIYKLWIGDS